MPQARAQGGLRAQGTLLRRARWPLCAGCAQGRSCPVKTVYTLTAMSFHPSSSSTGFVRSAILIYTPRPRACAVPTSRRRLGSRCIALTQAIDREGRATVVAARCARALLHAASRGGDGGAAGTIWLAVGWPSWAALPAELPKRRLSVTRTQLPLHRWLLQPQCHCGQCWRRTESKELRSHSSARVTSGATRYMGQQPKRSHPQQL